MKKKQATPTNSLMQPGILQMHLITTSFTLPGDGGICSSVYLKSAKLGKIALRLIGADIIEE